MEPKAFRGLLFGITLGFLCQFPGGITFLNYAVLIFEKSGASKIDPSVAAIMLAIAQIIGCFFSAKLVDSLGRKLLMTISFLGPAIGLFLFSIYLYFIQNGYDLSTLAWFPVATLTFIQFIATAGCGSLYSVCFIENLPTKVQLFPLNFASHIFMRILFLFCCCSGSNNWLNDMHSLLVRVGIFIRKNVSNSPPID